MAELIEIKIPDIGDFEDVEIIEVHVAVGDTVELEDPLITLESDKATMDVPASAEGKVAEMRVSHGDHVSEGNVVLVLRPTGSGVSESTPSDTPTEHKQVEAESPSANEQPTLPNTSTSADETTELVVIGSGPGGYTAAFRAADLGLKVTLIERYPTLGGVCLNVGCIPSKTLLHAAKVISDAKEMAAHGIEFGEPKIDIDKLRTWKEKVVGQLTGGLNSLSKQRKVTVVQGTAMFTDSNRLEINHDNKSRTLHFEKAIIAAGSEPTQIPGFPTDDPRVFDSTGALELKEIPERLLVVGGGIIGLEMAAVYHELGAKVTVVELLDQLIAGADGDLVKPLNRRIQKQYENIFLKTKVTSMSARNNGIEVEFDGAKAPKQDNFSHVLVAVGRKPNGLAIGAARAGVETQEHGFIPVNDQQQTNVPHIFAIGDISGQPMLAHKASHEGKVAAEVAADVKSGFDARVIPSVAYTDPEVAWVGVTENEAKQRELNYGKGVFPWAASGRSLSLGRSEGMTKLIFDENTNRIIGAGIVGPNAGDLIAEAALAIEMGCEAEDIGLTIHPHPTLSETIGFAAEAFEGTITDLYIPKKSVT